MGTAVSKAASSWPVFLPICLILTCSFAHAASEYPIAKQTIPNADGRLIMYSREAAADQGCEEASDGVALQTILEGQESTQA